MNPCLRLPIRTHLGLIKSGGKIYTVWKLFGLANSRQIELKETDHPLVMHRNSVQSNGVGMQHYSSLLFERGEIMHSFSLFSTHSYSISTFMHACEK